MPIVDKKPTDRPDLSEPAVMVAARTVTEVECSFIAPDGDKRATPVALLRLTTSGPNEAPRRSVFRLDPLSLVLVVQDLNDLLASHGGMVAVLRAALNHDTAPAAAPAFEGAER
jgi:hypothetical protein